MLLAQLMPPAQLLPRGCDLLGHRQLAQLACSAVSQAAIACETNTFAAGACRQGLHDPYTCSKERFMSLAVWPQAFQGEYGVEMRHMWGMTELSPIGSCAGFKVGPC